MSRMSELYTEQWKRDDLDLAQDKPSRENMEGACPPTPGCIRFSGIRPGATGDPADARATIAAATPCHLATESFKLDLCEAARRLADLRVRQSSRRFFVAREEVHHASS